jgi:hypothetical protein
MAKVPGYFQTSANAETLSLRFLTDSRYGASYLYSSWGSMGWELFTHPVDETSSVCADCFLVYHTCPPLTIP